MTTVTCLYCGASTSGIGGIHICDPRVKQAVRKKTDEELVEAMVRVGRVAYSDAYDEFGHGHEASLLNAMRAALAVVRGVS